MLIAGSISRMTDALLEAIAAAPDDDAPRLVWADREGGERGELVVIQCRLARHDVPRDERRRLTTRETELLEKNARAWSGYEGAHFVRGFVERLTIAVADLVPNVERIFASMPLLRDLRFEPLPAADPIKGESVEAAWAASEANLRGILGRLPPGRIRTLAISSSIELLPGPFDELSNTSWAYYHHDDELLALLIAAPSLASLRELVIPMGAIASHHIPALARLKLERLELGQARSIRLDVTHLLGDAASIERLAIWNAGLHGHELAVLLSYPEIGRLKELDLSYNQMQTIEDSQRIAECSALANLERLGIAGSNPQGVNLIARSPYLANLRELDVLGVRDAYRFLEGATFTESLRVLRASRPDEERLYAMFPALERIESAPRAKK
jgi:uncharacterized protein (TIGR02996 family)